MTFHPITNILHVTMVAGFPEDRRLSMEGYRSGLAQSLKDEYPEKIRLTEYIPQKPAVLNGLWGMRLARYLSLPFRLPSFAGEVVHIVDPGYGHLLNRLPDRPKVATVHDLIPLLRWKGAIPGIKPDHFPLLNILSYRALRQADALIAVSENTKRDLVRWLGCDSGRIHVIPYGLNPIFTSETGEIKPANPLGLNPAVKKILISGSQFYKNNETALKVFSRLKREFAGRVQLIKIGHSPAGWAKLVRRNRLEGDVLDLGAIAQETLPDVYRSADLLLFPSCYEGFGLPPLEAMACGTPVVASRAASIPEVVGQAAPLFDPFDVNGFVDEASRLLVDETYRRGWVEKGYERAAQFRWSSAAAATLRVYEAAASL